MWNEPLTDKQKLALRYVDSLSRPRPKPGGRPIEVFFSHLQVADALQLSARGAARIIKTLEARQLLESRRVDERPTGDFEYRLTSEGRAALRLLKQLAAGE